MWTYFTLSLTLRLALFLLAVVIAARFLNSKQPWWPNFRRHWRSFYSKPWRCAISIALLSLFLNGIFTALQSPQPRAHDEFSYLLASDTFASGRLTNPSHPLAEHFETYHVLSKPTYASKYPPGSSLFMALGQILTGHSIVGVWIAYALASASLYWMMRSWTTPRWAAIAGLLFASNGMFLRAWGQTWWGGSVALMGGALLFGGFHRLWSTKDTVKPTDAVALGIGMVLLSISRPAEGAFVSIVVSIALIYWYCTRTDISWSNKTIKAAGPILLIGCLGLGFIASYNHAVTGSVTKMPYVLHDQTYGANSMLIWKEPPSIPSYTHPRMERFYLEFGRERQLATQQFDYYWKQLAGKLRLLRDFLPIGIWISLLPLVFVFKSPWHRFAFTVVALVLLIHTQFCASFIYPHYLAPALALFFAINIRCLRLLKVWRRRQAWGLAIARGLILASILQLPLILFMWSQADISTPRSEVLTRLSDQTDSHHLIVCSYGDEYPIHFDWVYNEADIDESQIVWARDMGDVKNQKLLDYYPNRRAWRLHIESDDAVDLSPYEP